VFMLSPVRRGPPSVGILILAVASANLGLSLLSPVITQLRQDLLATADEAQLVLSGFMMSVALAQLLSGSLSDRFGRRYILLTGAVVFSLGGLGAMLASSVSQLVGFRILQGVGAAACLTMGRVIVNDSFEGADAARKMSIVSSAQAIVPLLGFGFGGVIAEFIGWRGSIAIMVFGGVLILWLAARFIAESRQGEPVPFRLR
jgi:MFS family permease